MPTKGDSRPVQVSKNLVRSKDSISLFEGLVVNDTNARYSDPITCLAFSKFLLLLYIDSTLTPTDVHIEVEFLDQHTGKWYSYKQGVYASLYYEDSDTASGIYECFMGECSGRAMRLKITGSGTTSSAYFTISASVELFG